MTVSSFSVDSNLHIIAAFYLVFYLPVIACFSPCAFSSDISPFMEINELDGDGEDWEEGEEYS